MCECVRGGLCFWALLFQVEETSFRESRACYY